MIADNSKVDVETLEDVEGVKGTFTSNGQLQIIIGTGTVNKVYDEFLAVTGMTEATKAEVKAVAAARDPLWKRILKVPGDIFVPILPAIVSAGLLMGIVEALGKVSTSFADTGWYSFLDLVSSTAFSYLPVLVAISAARVFGGNIFLGGVIGLCMINSDLINAWSVSSMNASDIPVWHLLCFNVKAVGYQGHVIPVIIAVYLMCRLEKWLHKHVPEMLDLFVTPLTTVLVTAFLTFTIIGPVFSTAETYVLSFARWLITVGHGVGAGAMGFIYPVTVVMGLHHMYTVIENGMLADTNLNIWMPIASAANFAQFGACLAVGVKARNRKTKAVAFPSALSASLGITEPAIFGVNFRFMKPFVFGMIGGAVGAVFGSISGIGATTFGVTGIPGMLAINHLLPYLILLLISGGIAFGLTMAFWKEEDLTTAGRRGRKKKAEKAENAEDSSEKPAEMEELPVIISCSGGSVKAPALGAVIPQEEISDPLFADPDVLGVGVGIEPSAGEIFAPFDGEISSVADSKHAIGITGPGEMEVLIHVGIDTVSMNGDGFTPAVAVGDKVTEGQKLLDFDMEKIDAAGHPKTVVVLLTNADDYDDVTTEIEPAEEELPVIFRTEAGDVKAPVEGRLVAMEDIPDDTFSSGLLGQGVGIEPGAGVIKAPFDGTVEAVEEADYAIRLRSKTGMEVLIHVGVDTVAMNGAGFDPRVDRGDEVREGDEILYFDIDAIRSAGHSDIVIVLLTNTDDFHEFEICE